jgi:hypothetical protein
MHGPFQCAVHRHVPWHDHHGRCDRSEAEESQAEGFNLNANFMTTCCNTGQQVATRDSVSQHRTASCALLVLGVEVHPPLHIHILKHHFLVADVLLQQRDRLGVRQAVEPLCDRLPTALERTCAQ